MRKKSMVWYDRKHLWCGLPWTFTKYAMDDSRLFVETGFLNIKQSEVRLYRILNISLNRTLIQRIFGLGTIHIDSTDMDLKCLHIINIRKSEDVKEMLSEAVEKERIRNRVSAREFMSASEDNDDIDNSTDDIDIDDNDDLDNQD